MKINPYLFDFCPLCVPVPFIQLQRNIRELLCAHLGKLLNVKRCRSGGGGRAWGQGWMVMGIPHFRTVYCLI